MKKVAFVSDFDGTISQKDFYHIMIDKYLGEWGKDFYNEWKATKKINVEFLNKIFSSINLSEQDLLKEILMIPIDNFAIDFIKKCREKGWDFYILSAGTSYYINLLLENKNIKDVPVISMEGHYNNGGLLIEPNPNSPYYSSVFGIDKRKFIEELKTKYEMVFFAGDSEPDLEASKEATKAFGKSQLALMLKNQGQPFIEIENFSQVIDYFERKEWFK